MVGFPRVVAVEALPSAQLRVTFEGGQRRVYDCGPLLERAEFRLLRDEGFFRAVRADPHGYGVVWNDGVDLAESELWLGGRPV